MSGGREVGSWLSGNGLGAFHPVSIHEPSTVTMGAGCAPLAGGYPAWPDAAAHRDVGAPCAGMARELQHLLDNRGA